MSKIKLPHVAIFLCALFAAFSLGYWMGGLPQSGTYTILTEKSPQNAEDPADVVAPPALAPATTPETAAANTTAPVADPAVPPPPSAESTSEPNAEPTVRDGRININTADAEELTDLPGIGPALSQRIIDYRNEHGPFAAPEDIIQVSGIGAKKLEALLPLIKTGG